MWTPPDHILKSQPVKSFIILLRLQGHTSHLIVNIL